MELLWHNGQVVLHNQRPNAKKQPPPPLPSSSSAPPPALDHNLFIQEDEMSSWLHYPLRDDDDFCSDLFLPPERQTSNQVVTAARPPVPSTVRPPEASSMRPPAPLPSSVRPPVRNFMNFSRLRGDFTGRGGESGPSVSKSTVRESTQVSATPARESDLTRRTDGIGSRGTVDLASRSAVDGGGGAYTVGHNRKGKAVVTTEPRNENPAGASSSLASKSEIEPFNETTIVDERKRKEREAIDETEVSRYHDHEWAASVSAHNSLLVHFSVANSTRIQRMIIVHDFLLLFFFCCRRRLSKDVDQHRQRDLELLKFIISLKGFVFIIFFRFFIISQIYSNIDW